MIDNEEVFFDGEYIDYWECFAEDCKEINEELQKYRLEKQQENEEEEG